MYEQDKFPAQLSWAWKKLYKLEAGYVIQGSHRLEKYLNIQDCLEKSLKIKFALKSTWKTLKGIEKSLNFTICKRI